jgi:hypothetical protein
MARIPIVQEDDPGTSAPQREFLQRVGQSRARGGLGEVFNSIRVLANHPRLANALIDLVQAARARNDLTPALSELAWTTASVVNACHY